MLKPKLKAPEVYQNSLEPSVPSPLQEVELYKSSQQEKLGLTVCYRTDEDEDQGIYVGEVKTRSPSLASLHL